MAAWSAGGLTIHEVYIVTVKGSFTIPFTGKTGGRSGRNFPRVSERTYEVDATTGQIGMSGGSALPSGTPGVVTFRERLIDGDTGWVEQRDPSRFSRDGAWWWSGDRWLPAVSSDRRWRWTGTHWEPQPRVDGPRWLTGAAAGLVLLGLTMFALWLWFANLPHILPPGGDIHDAEGGFLALVPVAAALALSAIPHARPVTGPRVAVMIAASVSVLIIAYTVFALAIGFAAPN